MSFESCHSGLDPESSEYQVWISAFAGMTESRVFFFETALRIQSDRIPPIHKFANLIIRLDALCPCEERKKTGESWRLQCLLSKMYQMICDPGRTEQLSSGDRGGVYREKKRRTTKGYIWNRSN